MLFFFVVVFFPNHRSDSNEQLQISGIKFIEHITDYLLLVLTQGKCYGTLLLHYNLCSMHSL